MALVKNTPAPAFEAAEDDEAAAAAAAPQAPAERKTPTPAVQAAATKAIAVAAGTAVTIGTKYSAAMKGLEYAFSLDDVRSIGLAAPRITVDTGGFAKDGKDLGKMLIGQVLSYNPRWLVSAGIQGDEGKALVKYSYDGITVDGENQTLKDYLDELKAQGYAKASIKEYTDLWCILTGGNDEAADVMGETVVVQLSPQSGGQLKWFQVQHGIKMARGLAVETDSLRMTVERTKMGSDTFGRVSFSAA